MTTAIVNVSDIRNQWTKVAKMAKQGDVLVVQNSKVSFVISAIPESDQVGFILDEQTKKSIKKSQKELKVGKAFKGDAEEVMKWLNS